MWGAHRLTFEVVWRVRLMGTVRDGVRCSDVVRGREDAFGEVDLGVLDDGQDGPSDHVRVGIGEEGECGVDHVDWSSEEWCNQTSARSQVGKLC